MIFRFQRYEPPWGCLFRCANPKQNGLGCGAACPSALNTAVEVKTGASSPLTVAPLSMEVYRTVEAPFFSEGPHLRS